MLLKPQELGSIPEETARVGHAAYPKGNVFMQMRDGLGTIYPRLAQRVMGTAVRL